MLDADSSRFYGANPSHEISLSPFTVCTTYGPLDMNVFISENGKRKKTFFPSELVVRIGC